MARRKSQKRRNKKYQVSNRQLKAKRPYKDTIFRMLYHDKENLLFADCHIRKCNLYGNEK